MLPLATPPGGASATLPRVVVPASILRKIYEYDPTYHEHYNICLDELHMLFDHKYEMDTLEAQQMLEHQLFLMCVDELE